MRNLVWLVVIGFVGACGGSKPAAEQVPANASAADCASTAGAVTKALASEEMKAELGAVTTDVTKRCSDDKWSAEAVSCLGGAHDKQGVHDCGYQHLTQAQQDKLDQATSALSALSWPRVMKKMAEFRDQFCACKDPPCAERVSEGMTKWSQEMAKQYQDQDPPKLTEDQQKQAAEIGEQMGKCMQTAMAAGGPPPAPLSVTAIDPAKGDAAGGTYVKITGTSFTADGPRNAKVFFGAKQGTVVRFASDTELIVEAPAGKAKDVVDVVLQFDPGGEMKLPKAFTYVKKK